MSRREKTGGGMQMDMTEGEDAYKVADSAYSEMVRRGLQLPPKIQGKSKFLNDAGVPEVPISIMEMSEQDIGELSTVVILYCGYINGQLADTEIRLKEAKEQHEFISSKVRLTKDGTSADKESRKITDSRYVLSRARMLEMECLCKLMKTVVDAWEGNWTHLSRMITLRDQEIKKGARHAHIEGMRRMSKQIEDQEARPRRLALPPTRPGRLPPGRTKE